MGKIFSKNSPEASTTSSTPTASTTAFTTASTPAPTEKELVEIRRLYLIFKKAFDKKDYDALLDYPSTDVKNFISKLPLLKLSNEEYSSLTNWLLQYYPDLSETVAKYLAFEGSSGSYFVSGFHGILASEIASARFASAGFEKLKEIALGGSGGPEGPDSKSSVEDRMYAFRTMAKMPISRGVDICFEVLVKIFEDKSFPVSEKYRLFASNSGRERINGFLAQKAYLYYYDHYPLGEPPEDIIYKVLSAQYILTHIVIPVDKREGIESWLLTLMNNTTSNELKAELADILLRLADPKIKIEAEKCLDKLSALGKVEHYSTVYLNAQNVHDTAITQSVANIIEKLFSDPLPVADLMDIRRELSDSEMTNHFRGKNDKGTMEKAISAFTRIAIDSASYSGYSSAQILGKVWSKMKTSPYFQNMQIRLIQELAEMDRTCSSGHVSRICNILSGYCEGFDITISPTSQLKANIIARYNTALRDLEKFWDDPRKLLQTYFRITDISGVKKLQEDISIQLISLEPLERRTELKIFLDKFSPYLELEAEFTKAEGTNTPLLTSEEFQTIYSRTVKEYTNS